MSIRHKSHLIVVIILRIERFGIEFAQNLFGFSRIALACYFKAFDVFGFLVERLEACCEISHSFVAVIVVHVGVRLEHAIGDGRIATVVYRDGNAEEYVVRERRRLQGTQKTAYCLLDVSMFHLYMSFHNSYLVLIGIGLLHSLVDTRQRFVALVEL